MSVGENPTQKAFVNPGFRAWFMSCVLAVIGLNGCGESKTPTNAVVPPPTPTNIAEPDTNDPPGGLELPAGAIPTASDDSPERGDRSSNHGTETSAQPSEGIQMPSTNGSTDSNTNSSNANSPSPTVLIASWEEILSAAKSSGKITVIDFWSLACEPCLKEFPGLVHLHKTMGMKVQCMAVDMDYDGRKTRPPQHYKSDVNAFLVSIDAFGFPTYVSSTPSDEIYAAAKLASIPAVMIFNAQGEIVKVFVDAGDSVGFSYEKDVIPFVKQLAESA